MHSRNELLDQLIPLRKRFPNYASYADATIDDIIDEKSIDKTFNLQAYIMESYWLENVAGSLVLHKLPAIAQFSPINAFAIHDFDNDGKMEAQ